MNKEPDRQTRMLEGIMRKELDERLAEIRAAYLYGAKRSAYPGQAADDIRHLLAVIDGIPDHSPDAGKMVADHVVDGNEMVQPDQFTDLPDKIAAVIRYVDGNNTLGAGALGEHIAEAVVALLQPRLDAADGWVCVPVEPTHAMSMDGAKSYGDTFYFKARHAAECWKAMLAAPLLTEAAIRSDERARIAKAILSRTQPDLRHDDATRYTDALFRDLAHDLQTTGDLGHIMGRRTKARAGIEAQAGAKALRKVADKLGSGPYSIARLPILSEADRLEREGK